MRRSRRSPAAWTGCRTLIRSFRNDANPKIAVTVDLLTTGIDVPKITNLVFLRRVNSRILYEQMIGRATRLCPEIGKEVFRGQKADSWTPKCGGYGRWYQLIEVTFIIALSQQAATAVPPP